MDTNKDDHINFVDFQQAISGLTMFVLYFILYLLRHYLINSSNRIYKTHSSSSGVVFSLSQTDNVLEYAKQVFSLFAIFKEEEKEKEEYVEDASSHSSTEQTTDNNATEEKIEANFRGKQVSIAHLATELLVENSPQNVVDFFKLVI